VSSEITWIDYETELMSPGNRLPMPAIATTWHPQDGARLWTTEQLPELWDRLLSDDTTAIGGHNVGSFDFPVTAAHLPWLRRKLWAKLESGQIVDTLVCERIIQINRGQRGELGLGALAPKYGIPFTDKDDLAIKAIRLSFGQFIGATEIPSEHAKYALGDAIVQPTLFERQWATGLISWNDQAMLTRQLFWQSLVSARGFRTDLDRVRQLEAMVTERIADLEVIARDCGFLRRPGKDGHSPRNMKAIHDAIAAAYLAAGMPVPRTDASKKFPNGQVRADRLTLEDVPGEGIEAERLRTLSEWSQLLAIRNKDVPMFMLGAQEPVHTGFGIADTTRATHRPNSANMGKMAGVRECVRARDGFALAVSDFKMLELVGIAQLCVERLGLRTLADKINSGADIHAEIGADILGCSVEEIVRRRGAGDHEASEARDAGKPANFGMNGGMQSAETFQLYARKSYGQRLSLDQCERIMASWRNRAIDQQAYLAAVRQTRNELGLYDVLLPRTEMIIPRGLARTAASNYPFQRAGMAVADRAGWLVTKAQYCTGEMAGSHLVLFVHDDLTSEVPLDRAAEHAEIQERLMCQASREVLPDCFAGVETKLVTHLSKGAKVTRTDGRLAVTAVAMPESIGHG
jgi:hypothetical protein